VGVKRSLICRKKHRRRHDDTTTINIIIIIIIIISGMMAMPQACALQASRHAVNSAGLMA
jgi:hypothetical protein